MWLELMPIWLERRSKFSTNVNRRTKWLIFKSYDRANKFYLKYRYKTEFVQGVLKKFQGIVWTQKVW